MTCLIFDLDGTLVDSEPLSGQVFITLLPELNQSAEVITNWCKGRKLADLAEELQNEQGFQLPKNFIPLFRKELARLFEQSLQPIDGAQDMLSKISQPRCIASNGPLVKMQQSLRICALEPYFEDKLFSAYEVESWKPAPGLFLYAAASMGFDPADCLVIEDSETGLQAAAAAGMKAIHYSPGQASKQAYHVNHLRELPCLIDELAR